MSVLPNSLDDPWAWLHEDEDQAVVPIDDIDVVAVLYQLGTHADQDRLIKAVTAGEARPRALVGPADVPENVEWVWVLTDLCEPDPKALATLLAAVKRDRYAQVVGCLTVEPRRRGSGTVIRDFGQTISRTGRLRTGAEPGELYQGQLNPTRVLGAPVCGMLIRGKLWRSLGGVVTELPPGLWGVELGWRANLMGAQVIVEPDAQVVDRTVTDEAEERAGGLALIAAHAPWGGALTRLRLLFMTMLAALGFVIGKDLGRAREEMRGLGLWMSRRDVGKAVRKALASNTAAMMAKASTKELLPGRLAGLRRAAEAVASRLADWVATFAGRPDETVSLDELIGDDFADQRRSLPKIPVVVVGLVLTLLLGGLAGRRLFGLGSLQGRQMLAAADEWLDMVTDYLAPAPGAAALAGPPWEALTGLGSLVTLGHPEWLTTVLVMACAPLAWLLAYRLARRFCGSAWLAAAAAGAYALAPALSGALNLTGFAAAVWAVLLPAVGYSMWWWQAGAGQDTWRGAAGAGLWLLVATAWFPLAWPLAVVAGVVAMVVRRHGLGVAQWLLALVTPGLLLVGPWARTLVAFPGRLLTGADPSLAAVGTSAVEPWRVPFLALSQGPSGVGSGDAWHRWYDGFTNGFCPPLWLSLGVVGVLWLAAIAGAIRRPRASLFLWGAVICGAGAIGVTRMLVWVPPGAWARPSGAELAMLMAGCLALAALIGLDGVVGSLRDRSLGLAHLGVLGLAVLGVAALVLGSAWWAMAGETKLDRRPATALPSFVADMQASDTPGRTLAISIEPVDTYNETPPGNPANAANGTRVTWSLLEGTEPRLGQVERGFALAGDPDAMQLADSVVGRLVGGSADDALHADLITLGVSNVWLGGGDQSIRVGISNTPGLQAGTGQNSWMVWPVPDSSIAMIVSGDERERTGDGQQVGAGDPGRVLTLAEPADPRWEATIGGRPLAGSSSASGPQFVVGSQEGVLTYRLDAGSLWWAWAQVAGLVVIVLLALPGVRPRTSGPRRMVGG